MRGWFVIAISLLLVGCDHRKPAFSDAEMQKIRAANPGMKERCLNDLRFGGVAAWDPDDPNCFEMLPAQRWSGLWDHGWEWSNFCPMPTRQQCHWNEGSLQEAPRGTWLTFSANAHLLRDLPDGVHRIEFIGRRTKVPGNFGHENDYEHLMVVDRIISIRAIPGEKYQKRF
ncbi:hypothetical protein LZ519_11425 [Sphingomonas sp. RG327]|jgi:hypothetical protein|uniref:Lipoprotein n=1 Tax=Sphingomonas anseongensis TaxID=2908207 RepID=A0ABT0RI17_9SPHN|nr:hypothetical protein [Sphingomonas anseongensis]MCL6679919.1 hypothetical protein [Sphingomonas anseongensis]